MTRGGQRRARCGAAEARTRGQQAHQFLEVAQLVASSPGEEGYPNVAATLAGIAASDAACCQALGERSRSQDHRDAVGLLSAVAPEGRQAANALRRLLDLKDTAHYGVIPVSAGQLRTAMRQAEVLVGVADRVLRLA